VKEREDKVKNERQRLDAEIEKSKAGVDKEEGERLFRCACTFLKRPTLALALTVNLSF